MGAVWAELPANTSVTYSLLLTIEKLAYQSGISKGGLSEIERNKKEPRAYTILKICSGLGITMKDFFDFEEINTFLSSL